MRKVIFLILFLINTIHAFAQLKVFKSDINEVIITRSDRILSTNWKLSPEAKPDVNNVYVDRGKSILVKYISKSDSISFNVNSNSDFDFVIVNAKGDSCFQKIKGYEFVPTANFSKSYIQLKKGKVEISIPEVYELVSVIIALTKTGESEKGLVNKDVTYYNKVKDFFKPYINDSIVVAIDKFIEENGEYYLRTNAYAFKFSKSGKIEQSKLYNRISYTEDEPNYLLPFISGLQHFSDQSNFRTFYKQEQTFYDEEISFFKDSLNYSEMIGWLEKHFPTIRYDYHNIIFSPLTGYNQGVIWFENNGFKELQPHVNFPYQIPHDLIIEDKSKNIFKGNIVFTELNHGYINKEADKYDDLISKALLNKRDKLIDPSKGNGYYGSSSETFKEYMNWALVSLRYIDYCSEKDLPTLFTRNRNYMLRRGFTQFPAFQEFIVELYRNRGREETLSDLYPKIIDWFDKL